MRGLAWFAPQGNETEIHPRSPSIKRILLVRANFRMGNAMLALPAIAAFRKNFPAATIDFVGSPISDLLFQGQPLNHHYVAPRTFPHVIWQYLRLMRRLRANRYDLAVDVGCSQSGSAGFIIGLSGARIRAGIAGKWDQMFNLKILKPREKNKYRKLMAFLTALHLEQIDPVGALEFSAAEKMAGLAKLESIVGKNSARTVGVFVGGRKLHGKRWPLENFAEVIRDVQQPARVSSYFSALKKRTWLIHFETFLIIDADHFRAVGAKVCRHRRASRSAHLLRLRPDASRLCRRRPGGGNLSTAQFESLGAAARRWARRVRSKRRQRRHGA